VTESEYDQSPDPATTTDEVAVTEPQYDESPDPEVNSDDVAVTEPEYDQSPDPDASDDVPVTEYDDAAPVADPRVRDAVRRLDELNDLAPADHVEVYEAVHSSLQESLAAASRQADESPSDGRPPS
jgi:hypothetical protein